MLALRSTADCAAFLCTDRWLLLHHVQYIEARDMIGQHDVELTSVQHAVRRLMSLVTQQHYLDVPMAASRWSVHCAASDG